ncbi:hypothetical protein ACB092_09G207100 [Castanea dentata]
MEHTLSRYSRGLEMDYPQHSSDDLAVEQAQDDVNALKNELAKLRVAYLRMLGKDLEDLSLKELQILEDQMSEGILAVKDKKEEVLLEQLKKSKIQEQKALLENEALRKQLDEIRRTCKSPFLEFNPLEKKFLLSDCPQKFIARENHRRSITHAMIQGVKWPRSDIFAVLQLEALSS